MNTPSAVAPVPPSGPASARPQAEVAAFWSARQRAGHRLHEISYRACFKPQLPRYFIERYTQPGDRVFDPFMGRGTTLLEGALMGRRVAGSDANPLCARLLWPRLRPPQLGAVEAWLAQRTWGGGRAEPERPDLLVFYHPRTLCALEDLRQVLRESQPGDPVAAWVRMVATNRLTGHSPGFFSVYTLPPNQAVSVASQRRINARRGQTPPYRDIAALILKKSRALLSRVTDAERERLQAACALGDLNTCAADALDGFAEASVDLVVTSPPFLDVVDYAADNALRCWFNGIAPEALALWQFRSVEDWSQAMARVFAALRRCVRPGGHIAFEVGDVRGGAVRLEEVVFDSAEAAGLTPVRLLIHTQAFTKTAHCWGVANARKGTNTHRIVLLQNR